MNTTKMSYREGDHAVRVHEQAAELRSARSELRALEAQLWATRAQLRKRKKATALAFAGWGALLGNVAGAAAWAYIGNPALMFFGAVICGLFGFVLGGSWHPVDDGFPEAPAARGVH